MKFQWPIRRKVNPTWGPILAYISPGRAIYSPKDYRVLTEAGYKNVSAVFGCVQMIARGAAGINWKVERRVGPDKWRDDPNHPLNKLLWRPNETEGKARFNEKVVAFKLLTGNSFILKMGVGDLAPRYLYSIRPDRTAVVAGRTIVEPILGYEYTVGGSTQPLRVEDVLHIQEFNPTDDFYGLSRLEVASKSIDISNWSMEWNLKLLQNDMRPAGAVVVQNTLTKTQREQMKNDLRQYQGAENAGSIPIFEAGGDWKQISLSPKDMDWLNSEKYNLRRICSIYNVASELMGDTESKTYSNMAEARKALYMEAILPEMDYLRDELANWLLTEDEDRVRLDYDRDSIEAIQEERAKKYQYLSIADWMRVNEKRLACGMDEIPEGNVVLVPMGKIPLAALIEGSVEGEGEGEGEGGEGNPPPGSEEKPPAEEEEITPAEEEEKPPTGEEEIPPAKGEEIPLAGGDVPRETKSFWTSKTERKRALWDNFVLRVKAKERALEPIVRKFLAAQEDRVVGAIRQGRRAKPLDVEAESARFAKAVLPWARNHFVLAGESGVQATKGELIVPTEESKATLFSMNPNRERKLYDMVVYSGTKLSQTTMERVLDVLNFAEGEGATVEEITQDIRAALGDIRASRARLIARTETAKIENWGQVEGYKESEFVERKGWLCAYVEESREAHIQADQTYRENPIPLDDAFEVGGELLDYPGDPVGSPGNICNCLCTTYPEIVEIGGEE